LLSQAQQQPTHLTVAQIYPSCRFHLRYMPSLYFLQHSQAVLFSLTQCHALRFHAVLGHP